MIDLLIDGASFTMHDWKTTLAAAIGVGIGLYVWRNVARTTLGSFVGTASVL